MDLDIDTSNLEANDWQDTAFQPDIQPGAEPACASSPKAPMESAIGTLDSSFLAEVPVTLRFEVGELVLSLSALREMAPGAVLPIADSLPPSVRVLCDGGLLGSGELVDLDGRLAVCLTQWGDAR